MESNPTTNSIHPCSHDPTSADSCTANANSHPTTTDYFCTCHTSTHHAPRFCPPPMQFLLASRTLCKRMPHSRGIYQTREMHARTGWKILPTKQVLHTKGS